MKWRAAVWSGSPQGQLIDGGRLGSWGDRVGPVGTGAVASSGKAADKAADERKSMVVFCQKAAGSLSWRGEQRERKRAPESVNSEVRGVCPRR